MLFAFLLAPTLLATPTAHATDGYAADLFMDSAHDLTSRDQLYAAEFLGLSYDALVTDNIDVQNATIVGDAEDPNGALLYPDGAPRYRVIYTNGGSATGHGTSLGEDGRQRVRDFVAGGGSYTGSCAGAFITMLHYSVSDWEADGDHEPYYHLWPGVGDTTYTGSEYHDIVFEQTDHPLVAMYPSLADGLVSDVYHNYGCRLDPDNFDMPPGTTYLGLMDDPGTYALDGYYNMLIYEGTDEDGRVVVTCSHPEGHDDGEQLDLTAAILQHALDGMGSPWGAKGMLGLDRRVGMERQDELLGDGQYHHWEIELPANAAQLEIRLEALEADADLYVMFDQRPDRGEHLQASEQPGTQDERIVLESPQPGTWHVAVYGDHDILAGAAYDIVAHWELSSDPVDTGYLDTDDDGFHQDGPRAASLEGCGCGGGTGSAGILLGLLAGGVALRRRLRG